MDIRGFSKDLMLNVSLPGYTYDGSDLTLAFLGFPERSEDSGFPEMGGVTDLFPFFSSVCRMRSRSLTMVRSEEERETDWKPVTAEARASRNSERGMV